MRSRRRLTLLPWWRACSPHSGLPLHACCTSIVCTVPTQSDPEVLVEEEQHGEKQEAMAKTPTRNVHPEAPNPHKMHPGLQLCGKNFESCGKKKPLQLLPTASAMGWYEVCLSLRRVLGPKGPCGKAARCICWLCSRSGGCAPSTPRHLPSHL